MPISISWKHTYCPNVSFYQFLSHFTSIYDVSWKVHQRLVVGNTSCGSSFSEITLKKFKARFESNLSKSYKTSYSAKFFLVKQPNRNTFFRNNLLVLMSWKGRNRLPSCLSTVTAMDAARLFHFFADYAKHLISATYFTASPSGTFAYICSAVTPFARLTLPFDMV